MQDTIELIAGVPMIVITPAVVDAMKRAGLPVRWAGLAAVMTAMLLLALGDLALGGVPGEGSLAQTGARWIVGGVVYGLAAVGLYSQQQTLFPETAKPTSTDQ